MPNIKSAKKRMVQDAKRRIENRGRRSRLRTQLRKLEEAIAAGDKATAAAEWKTAQTMLDRTAQRGVIHPNQAARKKARLAKRLNALG